MSLLICLLRLQFLSAFTHSYIYFVKNVMDILTWVHMDAGWHETNYLNTEEFIDAVAEELRAKLWLSKLWVPFQREKSVSHKKAKWRRPSNSEERSYCKQTKFTWKRASHERSSCIKQLVKRRRLGELPGLYTKTNMTRWNMYGWGDLSFCGELSFILSLIFL
jgi:hypothetical protein